MKYTATITATIDISKTVEIEAENLAAAKLVADDLVASPTGIAWDTHHDAEGIDYELIGECERS